MPVIAMTQEMASLGKDVAQEVAEQLNLTVIRNEISEEIAGKLKKPKSAIRRYMEGHAKVAERFGTRRSSIAVYSAEEVYEYALEGNVLIRGWAGNYLLRQVPHVLCTRICAPLEQRAQWLMKRLDTDDHRFAVEEIRRSDAAHTANIQHWFHKTWGDPLDHDLVINTARVPVKNAAQLIVEATQQPEFQETEASRQELADLMLESKCRSELLHHKATQGVHVNIHVHKGHVTLTGVVVDGEEREACEGVLSDVAGVQSIDDQLRAMSDFRVYR